MNKTVTIGNQVWSTKNLDESTFRNGDFIIEAKKDQEWEVAGKLGTPAWCYYNNDPATKAAADNMFSRAANTVSSGTRGFTSFAMSGPTIA